MITGIDSKLRYHREPKYAGMLSKRIRVIYLCWPGVPGAGDCGKLLGPTVTSPFMMSCIEVSSLSTRLDICDIRSSICEDISSNFDSSVSKI